MQDIKFGRITVWCCCIQFPSLRPFPQNRTPIDSHLRTSRFHGICSVLVVGYKESLSLPSVGQSFNYYNFLDMGCGWIVHISKANQSILLSCVWVTVDGVWIDDQIQWTLTDRNYSAITNSRTLRFITA
jgi:hypothetical protein